MSEVGLAPTEYEEGLEEELSFDEQEKSFDGESQLAQIGHDEEIAEKILAAEEELKILLEISSLQVASYPVETEFIETADGNVYFKDKEGKLSPFKTEKEEEFTIESVHIEQDFRGKEYGGSIKIHLESYQDGNGNTVHRFLETSYCAPDAYEQSDVSDEIIENNDELPPVSFFEGKEDIVELAETKAEKKIDIFSFLQTKENVSSVENTQDNLGFLGEKLFEHVMEDNVSFSEENSLEVRNVDSPVFEQLAAAEQLSGEETAEQVEIQTATNLKITENVQTTQREPRRINTIAVPELQPKPVVERVSEIDRIEKKTVIRQEQERLKTPAPEKVEKPLERPPLIKTIFEQWQQEAEAVTDSLRQETMVSRQEGFSLPRKIELQSTAISFAQETPKSEKIETNIQSANSEVTIKNKGETQSVEKLSGALEERPVRPLVKEVKLFSEPDYKQVQLPPEKVFSVSEIKTQFEPVVQTEFASMAMADQPLRWGEQSLADLFAGPAHEQFIQQFEAVRSSPLPQSEAITVTSAEGVTEAVVIQKNENGQLTVAFYEEKSVETELNLSQTEAETEWFLEDDETSLADTTLILGSHKPEQSQRSRPSHAPEGNSWEQFKADQSSGLTDLSLVIEPAAGSSGLVNIVAGDDDSVGPRGLTPAAARQLAA